MTLTTLPRGLNEAAEMLMKGIDQDGAAGFLTNALAAVSWFEPATKTAKKEAAKWFRQAANAAPVLEYAKNARR